MPDYQIPDPRGEDRELRGALARARRSETRAAYAEVARLEGQIEANRIVTQDGWYRTSPSKIVAYATAAVAATLTLGAVLFLIVGVLGTFVWALIILGRLFGLS